MADCKNPECKNGSTPGVIAAGRGTKFAPVVGATMRWGWVNCRSCSPKDKDPPFDLIRRTPQEIQERARLADTRATYVKAVENPRLAKIKASSNGAAPHAPPPDNSAQLSQLIDTVTKLSTQVAELLAENARLRSQGSPEAPKASDPVPTQPRKRKSRQIAK